MEEKQKDSSTSTQKEEPIHIPDDKPSHTSTPAHPLPKFLPKKIAVIVLILIFIVFAIGLVSIFLNKNSAENNQIATTQITGTVTPHPTFTEHEECTRYHSGDKLCPDGISHPYLSGKECEITKCPSTNTSDWKTFNDPKGRFSIKYPETWEVKTYTVSDPENPDLPKADPLGIYFRDPNVMIGDGIIHIKVYPDYSHLSFYDFQKQYWCAYNYVEKDVIEKCTKELDIPENININGEQFPIAGLIDARGAGGPATWISHDDYAVFITSELYGDESDNFFNQVLSTFKFTQ